ncbi:MAG: hypothetical protein ACM3QW_04495 [Ignavibacteriales bacterium]
MDKEITLVFRKKGLRSLIEVDLCSECPRQDNKGCCGYYSPVFYPTDLAFIKKHKPELIDYIFSLPCLTVLDASVTVNSTPDTTDGSYYCQFHTLDQGCLVPMELRESVCRHFVCPGIGWWEDENLAAWKEYFDQLADFEIALNNTLAAQLKTEGLSLRNPADRDRFLSRLESLMDYDLYNNVPLGENLPSEAEVRIRRSLSFGREWIL